MEVEKFMPKVVYNDFKSELKNTYTELKSLNSQIQSYFFLICDKTNNFEYMGSAEKIAELLDIYRLTVVQLLFDLEDEDYKEWLKK